MRDCTQKRNSKERRSLQLAYEGEETAAVGVRIT